MYVILNKDVQRIDHEEIFVTFPCDIKFVCACKPSYEDLQWACK